VDEEVRLFKALADPTRFRLAILLALRGETCVCDLTRALKEPQYKVSRHLSILRAAGVVTARREGTWMHYQLAPLRSPVAQDLFATFRGAYRADPGVMEMLRRMEGASARSAGCRATPAPCKDAGNRPRVLFLCTGNACRSQMAEGWARHLKGDVVEAWSAGIEKHGLNPLAVRVMGEAGVDISKQWSKTVRELPDLAVDWVVTVCGHAREHCPVFPGWARRVHAGFEGPPKLAEGARSDEEALQHYRRVRDEIRDFVLEMPEVLEKLWRKQHGERDDG